MSRTTFTPDARVALKYAAIVAVCVRGAGWSDGSRVVRGEDNTQAVQPVDVNATPRIIQPSAPNAATGAPVVSTPAPVSTAPAEPQVVAGTRTPTTQEALSAAPATAPALQAGAGSAPLPATSAETQAASQSASPAGPVRVYETSPSTAPVTPTPEAPVVAAVPLPAATQITATEPSTQSKPVVAAPTPVATTAAATAQDGNAYPITQLFVNYLQDHANQPPIEQMMKTSVKLGVTTTGYVAARPGIPTIEIPLAAIGESTPQKIYRSGIESIYGQIVRYFNERGIIGVFVVIDAKDIDSADNDIRPTGKTSLQFIVVTSVVKQVRTLATGDSSNGVDRVDNPRHAEILKHSPLKAGGDDLLNKKLLDEYVMRLNRQPGRRVDAAISGSGELGAVDLDYLVSENRPWYVYMQASNTGTKQTNSWRERIGFVDNQLTNHDDVLSLDYMTAGFDASHAVIGAYELPFFSLDRLRYKAYASYSTYTASDVGQANEQFTGTEYTVGNELIMNIFQRRELFVDAAVGVRVQGITTDNKTSAISGDATYISPYGSLRLERATDLATTLGSLTLIGYTTGAEKEELVGLGRASPSRNPVVLQYDFSQSFFIEPLVNPEAFVSGKSTLAHEMFFSTHGQYAFNYRLIPQIQDVAGGFYSVRGYPESIVAGDTLFVGTAEYRLHIPRLFPVQPDATKTPFLFDKRFRFAPEQVYGHPDWDLIARTFVDVGRVVNTDHLSYENNTTLVGTGVGLELQYKQNLNIRIDWGVALTDIPKEVEAGSNRFHISATLLY